MSPAGVYQRDKVLDLLPVDDVTADGNGTGVDISVFEGTIAFDLYTKNKAGTTPTLAVKLQHSSDDGATDAYADVTGGGFTGATTNATSQTLFFDKNALKKFVRMVKDIGGTSSPSYAVHGTARGVRKYPA